VKTRVVYSSDRGSLCPKCGWPADACKCSSTSASAPVPATLTAKLRIEKKGRGGKTITVVDGLPDNAAFLAELARDLKRSCGVGGAAREGAIELQGDCRESVRRILTERGHKVRG
jgi:translation initiation factor 1